MNVHRINRRGPDGRIRASAKWCVGLRDHRGRSRRVAGYTDKAATEELGNKLVRLVAARAARRLLDKDLATWVEAMHPTLRRRLLALDLLDPQAIDAAKPLMRHLADFHQALLDQGRTRDYADLVKARVGHVIAGCRFKLLSDIRPSTAERYLADLRRGAAASPADDEKRRRAISVQTAGHYVASLKAFCNWMVRDGRAAENPLASLRKQNPAADRRHVRRALAGDEAQRLLDATRDGPPRYGIDGPERAAIYWLALETGLRLSEIGSLRRRDLDLEGDDPTVGVGAGSTKNRRACILPLRRELAEHLAGLLATKLPEAPAFRVPARGHAAKLLRFDLDAARAAWLKEAEHDAALRAEGERSGFLAARDDAGRVVDFHALRHTFITNLARGGVHPKVAQTLARHSTVELTLGRYSHVLVEDQRAGVEALPAMTMRPAGAARATGTAGAARARMCAPTGKEGVRSGNRGPGGAAGGPRPVARGEGGEAQQTQGFDDADGGDENCDDGSGEVAERLNAPVSKTGLPFGATWVRIPPSPLLDALNQPTHRPG